MILALKLPQQLPINYQFKTQTTSAETLLSLIYKRALTRLRVTPYLDIFVNLIARSSLIISTYANARMCAANICTRESATGAPRSLRRAAATAISRREIAVTFFKLELARNMRYRYIHIYALD